MKTLFVLTIGCIAKSSPFVLRARRGYQRRNVLLMNAPEIPDVVESPVLKQVYPALLSYIQEYGHPNIPLGSSEGRQCKTLRRLHTQQLLTQDEVELLTEMNFQFNSLENVYQEASFEELFERLIKYEQEQKTGYMVPKKYAQDPELGAWVTGIRRLGPSGVDANHCKRLNEIGFAWKSNRQCGSRFMSKYREFEQEVSKGNIAILESDEAQNWVTSQRLALERGTLSETRVHYMARLFGEDWNKETGELHTT